jgi:hypothetical protein
MEKVTVQPESVLHVDSKGYVYVDGVKVAKYVPEKQCLQFLDKDRIRSNQRGSNVVEVPIAEVAKIGAKK